MITLPDFNDCKVPDLQLITLRNRNGLVAQFTNRMRFTILLFLRSFSNRAISIAIIRSTGSNDCSFCMNYLREIC